MPLDVAAIEAIPNPVERIIEASRVLHNILKAKTGDRSKTLGALSQEQKWFQHEGFISRLNYALKIRNDLAHGNDEEKPCHDEAAKASTDIVHAIRLMTAADPALVHAGRPRVTSAIFVDSTTRARSEALKTIKQFAVLAALSLIAYFTLNALYHKRFDGQTKTKSHSTPQYYPNLEQQPFHDADGVQSGTGRPRRSMWDLDNINR